MMKRKIYSELLRWKERPGHRCLIVSGQRQVGKTFIIQQFANDRYDNVIYIDFNRDISSKKLFQGDLNVDDIVQNIEQYLNVDVAPGSIIIFDEIQECNDARSSLKYFSLDGRYDVIASGSLLGVNLPNQVDSDRHLIPVGYEEHLVMHSMDFEEFLWALGIKDSTIGGIKNKLSNKEPLNESILNKIDNLFRDFMIVGGMPASVEAFVKTGKYTESGRILNDLIQSCRNDIIRYCPTREKIKTLECFDSIPSQLSKMNKKYMFSEIKGESSRKAFSYYSENLLWIKGAGYGNFCMALDGPILPLNVHEIKNSFKVYLSDTGMLAHMYDNDVIKAIYGWDSAYNFGAIVENEIAESLMKCGYQLRSYKKNAGTDKMEIDFVIVLGGELTAIEVKSGRKRDSPSLNKSDIPFEIKRKIKLEKSNIYSEGGIDHYPLFAACFIDTLKGDNGESDF